MRSSLVALLLALPAVAAAEPRPDIIWSSRPRASLPSARSVPDRVGFTSISHVLYLNPCLPDGCNVRPGFDDARQDASSIPLSASKLSAWKWGDAKWNTLVQCVKDTYAPFDVEITTTDPGNAPHSEVMIGGTAAELNNPDLQNAGGAAPFLGCGATEDNTISFVFAGDVDPGSPQGLNYLCGAVAQESSHVYGLDHELDADDPMTYLKLGTRKVFQDSQPRCGEALAQPRDCFCGGPTQNSYRFLMDTFGPKTLMPATLTITTPRDDAWVKPGFPVRFTTDDQVSLSSASVAFDGGAATTLTSTPFVFDAPDALAGGDHTVAVSASDLAGRTLSAQVTVHVTATCDADHACARGTHCLGGYCLPGADVAGGLGAACTTNEACVTGTCGTAGADTLCTGPCDAGDACPSGYTCLGSTGAGGVCWPAPPADDGGCASGGAGGLPALALAGFAALVRARRRR